MILKDLEAALPEFELIKIDAAHIQDVYNLMKTNDYFFDRTQSHEVNLEECIADLTAVPPGTRQGQKYYYAFYQEGQCAGILDYIEDYPKKDEIYIGLFMLAGKLHRKGLGTRIMTCFLSSCFQNGFQAVELGCYETNEMGCHFWTKRGFLPERITKRETDGRLYNLISMKKTKE